MIDGIEHNIQDGYIVLIDIDEQIGFLNRIEKPYKRDFVLRPEVIGKELFMSLNEGDHVKFISKTIRNRRHAIIISIEDTEV